MENITLTDIKKNNYSLIYHLLYKEEKLPKQEIANRLHLSLPTVTQNLVRLEKEGFIEKGGQFESQVGRRAVAYTLCPQARISIGVEILKKQIRILALDLKGKVITTEQHLLTYENIDSYYQALAQLVNNFIENLPCTSEQILGIGFAVQGLTSVDGAEITYGMTLGYTGLKITALSRYLEYPCKFFHDAKCAASTELWYRNDLTDAVYLSIGKHLGGVLIMNGHVIIGKGGHCGAVEHMTLIPDGLPCYCGNNGCIETYCSANALLHEDETLDSFFREVRNENPEYEMRWAQFLHLLTIAIANLHMMQDCDIILGGHMAPYLNQNDLKILNNRTMEKSIYPDSEDYIQISQSPEHSVPIGAALPYILDFLSSI